MDDEVLEGLHRVELQVARLAGEVQAMRDLKAQADQQIAVELARIDRKAGHAHERLDRYPPAEAVATAVVEFTAFRNRVIGAAVAGLALGITGGTAITQLLGG
jgi:hypothetical protein